METIIGTDLSHAVALLKAGQVVAIPTETVYGLAANGLDESAILKIFEAKGRPLSNPLILHFESHDSIRPYITDFPKELEMLAAVFWPGPLTILLPKSKLVPELITAGLNRVGVRVSAHLKLKELLENLPFPLAAPSANLYGLISPTKSTHVHKQLNGKIPYILEGGDCQNGIESTIVGIEEEKVVVYRLGGISVESIATNLGYKPIIKNQEENQPVTSGMVKYHYAPITEFAYLNSDFVFSPHLNDGFILLKDSFPEIPSEQKFILSESGDINEAAKKMYDAMHQMDQKGFSKLYIEKFENVGLGLSLNDRLNRATKKFEK
jgi:L-threonylcarbamoyladenylate synthase